LEIRSKAVQLYLEEGFPPGLVAREMGVGRSTLSKWVRLYRDHGEASLKSQETGPGRRRPKVATAVKEKVVELKRGHPDLASRRSASFCGACCFCL
jgi:transposase-like protein